MANCNALKRDNLCPTRLLFSRYSPENKNVKRDQLMFPDNVFLAIFTTPCMLLKNQTFSMWKDSCVKE